LRERWPDAPVILLTSHRAATDEPDQLGADALLLKPFDVDELTDVVSSLIGRSEKRAPEPRLRLEA
jgi:DNA-binding response OmpR family regulator